MGLREKNRKRQQQHQQQNQQKWDNILPSKHAERERKKKKFCFTVWVWLRNDGRREIMQKQNNQPTTQATIVSFCFW